MVDLRQIVVQRDGEQAVFNGSWYRGRHTHFIPSKAQIQYRTDVVDEVIMRGWEPAHRFITRDMLLTAFGSCFAAHITQHLIQKGYKASGSDLSNQSHLIRFGEGMVNSFAILQQLEWAIDDKQFPANLWFSENKEIASVDPAVQDATRQIIHATDVFIITLGLSEIWYDKRSGDALWRAVPADLFDEEIHGFRVSTHQENLDNLRRICAVIHKAKPEARIVFTVSPIPLMATFRPISCLTANSVSKSILRSAVDEMIRESTDSRLHYFPSYEIVKDFFADPFEADNRHPRAEVIDFIMNTFERHFCCP